LIFALADRRLVPASKSPKLIRVIGICTEGARNSLRPHRTARKQRAASGYSSAPAGLRGRCRRCWTGSTRASPRATPKRCELLLKGRGSGFHTGPLTVRRGVLRLSAIHLACRGQPMPECFSDRQGHRGPELDAAVREDGPAGLRFATPLIAQKAGMSAREAA
jgi:hypothetical protein